MPSKQTGWRPCIPPLGHFTRAATGKGRDVITVQDRAATIELYSFTDKKSMAAAKEQLASTGTIYMDGDTLLLIDKTDGVGNPVSNDLINKLKGALIK